MVSQALIRTHFTIWNIYFSQLSLVLKLNICGFLSAEPSSKSRSCRYYDNRKMSTISNTSLLIRYSMFSSISTSMDTKQHGCNNTSDTTTNAHWSSCGQLSVLSFLKQTILQWYSERFSATVKVFVISKGRKVQEKKFYLYSCFKQQKVWGYWSHATRYSVEMSSCKLQLQMTI